MAVSSVMVPLGTPAPDFRLPAVGGGTVALADLRGPALLVMFICNHCPYVRHIEKALGATVAEYAERGLAAVGICANDTDAYPDDTPEHLAEQARRAGFTFPYLVDETQEVARAYRAVCTPDLFLYDAERRLAYRGAFDASTPKNGVPVTGELLRAALDRVLAGEPVPEPHRPSMGCSIKWKPGNEPDWLVS
ncbi:alkyl hydroperoxide reductase [Carbonactinospora thermoautotrophica]|uniref:Alkyl hydroperoxide reductase n=2 Tax=Carbonactinospora thermoautotrophica TaxID=1469144 RepID=A0A132N3T1_9ACTN|nr:thioredoxin family protein [Carbonactinospora thermoautotrophica]KWX04252.1 alkyl hydroperoxide reductase [Carbonactinospora thermoautotrophica]KWX06638.1 alkyl hydroperoxide reductase [Carbonactinospora thermoautotrophica]